MNFIWGPQWAGLLNGGLGPPDSPLEPPLQLTTVYLSIEKFDMHTAAPSNSQHLPCYITLHYITVSESLSSVAVSLLAAADDDS